MHFKDAWIIFAYSVSWGKPLKETYCRAACGHRVCFVCLSKPILPTTLATMLSGLGFLPSSLWDCGVYFWLYLLKYSPEKCFPNGTLYMYISGFQVCSVIMSLEVSKLWFVVDQWWNGEGNKHVLRHLQLPAPLYCLNRKGWKKPKETMGPIIIIKSTSIRELNHYPSVALCSRWHLFKVLAMKRLWKGVKNFSAEKDK